MLCKSLLLDRDTALTDAHLDTVWFALFVEDIGAKTDDHDDKRADDKIETVIAIQDRLPPTLTGQQFCRRPETLEGVLGFRQSSLAALRFSGRMPSSIEVRARRRTPGPPSS